MKKNYTDLLIEDYLHEGEFFGGNEDDSKVSYQQVRGYETKEDFDNGYAGMLEAGDETFFNSCKEDVDNGEFYAIVLGDFSCEYDEEGVEQDDKFVPTQVYPADLDIKHLTEALVEDAEPVVKNRPGEFEEERIDLSRAAKYDEFILYIRNYCCGNIYISTEHPDQYVVSTPVWLSPKLDGLAEKVDDKVYHSEEEAKDALYGVYVEANKLIPKELDDFDLIDNLRDEVHNKGVKEIGFNGLSMEMNTGTVYYKATIQQGRIHNDDPTDATFKLKIQADEIIDRCYENGVDHNVYDNEELYDISTLLEFKFTKFNFKHDTLARDVIAEYIVLYKLDKDARDFLYNLLDEIAQDKYDRAAYNYSI